MDELPWDSADFLKLFPDDLLNSTEGLCDASGMGVSMHEPGQNRKRTFQQSQGGDPCLSGFLADMKPEPSSSIGFDISGSETGRSTPPVPAGNQKAGEKADSSVARNKASRERQRRETLNEW